MQYKQRALVIFPLLQDPKSACMHGMDQNTALGPDLPTVEVVTNLLAK
jgi:hypothetical protein